jgi:signal transduction histidine kinase/DNA-binding response OmpR family regulator/HPt (histidine-containing phosphotransfer) domain-containing protein
MKLRYVAWALVSIVLVVCYGAIDYQIRHRVILDRFAALEEIEARKDMARCLDAIQRELYHLNNLAGDWAVWDDTFRFARDGNQAFIDSNLQMETLEENGDINLICILNPRGETVWGEAYSGEMGGEISVRDLSGRPLDRIMAERGAIEDGLLGLVLTDHGPMYVAVQAILDSQGQGPSSGVLMMGRFMSEDIIASLVEQTKVMFEVKALGGALDELTRRRVVDLETRQVILEADGDDQMEAFGLIDDLDGRPALLVQATLPRPIMDKGRSAARYVSMAMMGAVGFCVLFLLFMARVYVHGERRRREQIESLVDQRTMELRLAKEDAEQARIAAVDASRAKSEFLANMSHEIRTPLNGVIGMAEIALSRARDERQRDILETINREAQSLLGIINSILDFSKIEAGKVELEAITFDLRLLLSDVGKSITFLAERKGLTCDVVIDSETPRCVSGDPGRLRQVLMNLTGNALKFTERGGLTIRCDLVERLDETVVVRFAVTDTGIGIAGDKREKIFESFTQADGSTTRKYGGTGLGISISKQLVELMGGRMGLDSEEGQGSTFWFVLPLILQKSRRARAGDQPNVRPLIFVVGGCADTPPEYVESLRDLGYTVETRPTGQDVLNRLRTEGAAGDIQLLMIEACLEDTDGFVLAETLRSMAQVKHTPIILTTRSGAIGDGRRCQDIGINGYLHGPLSALTLQHAVLMAMGAIRFDRGGEGQDLITRHTIEEMIGNQARILLVDDYPTNRQVAMNMLTLSGYAVDVAENGRQAVDAFVAGQYGLVFMDVQMPVLDGFEATRIIREQETAEGRSRTPIIAMTANVMDDDRAKCLAAGMDDFIAKPVTRQALLSMIAAWTVGSVGVPDVSGVRDASVASGDTFMDFDRALDEFMGDRVVLLNVLSGFRDQGLKQIPALRTAVDKGMTKVVADEAHKIKGGAANLAMDRLAGTASRLEKAARAGDLVDAPALIDVLAGEFDRLAETLAKEAAREGP